MNVKRMAVVFLVMVALVMSASSALWAAETGKVNINTATEEELMTLEQIGAARAAAIVKYRTEVGPFAVPEDLMNVSGIGEKIFEMNKDRIIVAPETTEGLTPAQPATTGDKPPEKKTD